jgi:hypothetical protein
MLLFYRHGMALRVQLVRSLQPPPTLLHADSGQAHLCFTVPEKGSELLGVLASSPPHLPRDVQASLSHACPQDGHGTDGSAFLNQRWHEQLSDTSAVFVAPEDLSIDSLKGAESAQHEQIGGIKDTYGHDRAEDAIAALQPTRKSTRRPKRVAVKPDRVSKRRLHDKQRSCDARGQFRVHFEELPQL